MNLLASFKAAAANNNQSTTDAMTQLSANGLSSSSPILVGSNSTLAALNNAFNGNGGCGGGGSGNGGLPLLHFEQNYSQALSEVVATL